MLTVAHSIPDGLLDLAAHELHRQLRGPTLFHLPGRRAAPLFVSVLLHGNETTGWDAARSLLRRYRDRELPRNLSLLVGNVSAAHAGVRHLDGQPDYNRVWRGSGTAEHRMARRVLAELSARSPFAAIDVHNTSGRNPHYACVTVLERTTLRLARDFTSTVVYFTQPNTTQTVALAGLCPAVTVECGMPGEAHGVERAEAFIERCLNLRALPADAHRLDEIEIFHSIASVRVPGDVSVGLDGECADLCLSEDLDRLNFHRVPEGTPIGTVAPGSNGRLEAWDESGAEVADLYFRRCGEQIVTAVPIMPALLTTDERVIRQDCLGYVMERWQPLDAEADERRTGPPASGETGVGRLAHE